MTTYQFIRATRSDRVARLILAHPPMNILNIAMIREINTCLDELSTHSDLCALVIDADGPTFSAGVDIPEHRRDTVAEMLSTFHETFQLLNALPMPVIAAVHGGVYGGGMELAVFCDIVLASDDLKIGVPEITLGVYPPVAIVHLARVIGAHKAAELVLTGRILSAQESLAIGLVNHVYPAATFRQEVDSFVQPFTRLSAFSLGQARRAFRRALTDDFDQKLTMAEDSYLKDLMSGHDPAEGLTAFMEKRPPNWRHR